MESLALNLITQYGLMGVFISTLLAYSIIPFPSEAAIIAASFIFNPIIIILVALAGSTIGSITNYYLGRKGLKKVINHNSKAYNKATKLFDKYGPISLILFIGFPLIGDPLVILTGSLRMKLSKFLFYSTIGKIIYFTIAIWVGKGLETIIFT